MLFFTPLQSFSKCARRITSLSCRLWWSSRRGFGPDQEGWSNHRLTNRILWTCPGQSVVFAPLGLFFGAELVTRSVRLSVTSSHRICSTFGTRSCWWWRLKSVPGNLTSRGGRCWVGLVVFSSKVVDILAGLDATKPRTLQTTAKRKHVWQLWDTPILTV